MVCALRFERDGVHFTNRFVRTHKFVAEEKAGHPLFRTFGTAFPADQMKRGIALESPGTSASIRIMGRSWPLANRVCRGNSIQ